MSLVEKLKEDGQLVFANKRVIRKIGMHGAILLQELVYWHDRFEKEDKLVPINKTKRNGFAINAQSFFTTDEFLEQQTAMTIDQIVYYRRKLVRLKLVDTILTGQPPKLHYVIFEKEIEKILNGTDSHF